MVAITYIVSAVVLLGLCIFVHELGHLLGGKMVGIKAKTFSLGYGHGVIKKKWGDTTYQIGLIPLGGFCSFYGEDATEVREGTGYEFLSAHPLKRIVAVVMGPLFNLIFGIILFFVMNMVGFEAETNRIFIPEYFRSGEYVAPAFEAGLKDGDEVTRINDDEINSFGDIQNAVMFSDGESLRFTVQREGKEETVDVTPKKYGATGYYTVGVLPWGSKVMVAGVISGGAAEAAGLKEYDEITAVDGTTVRDAESFTALIRTRENKQVTLDVLRRGEPMTITVTPAVRELLTVTALKDERLENGDTELQIDDLSLVRSAIADGKVLLNGAKIASFEQLVTLLDQHKGQVVTLENPGGTWKGMISYEHFGFMGVQPVKAPDMVTVQFGPGKALLKAFVDPVDFIVLNLRGIGMLFSGKLDVSENLSGPIKIAKIAGDTAYHRGIAAFIVLMAKISIILMVMNLLPIPAVDGSYILFFGYEAIIGRPIKQKVMEVFQMVGFGILILLFVFVIFNDLASFSFFQNLFK